MKKSSLQYTPVFSLKVCSVLLQLHYAVLLMHIQQQSAVNTKLTQGKIQV